LLKYPKQPKLGKYRKWQKKQILLPLRAINAAHKVEKLPTKIFTLEELYEVAASAFYCIKEAVDNESCEALEKCKQDILAIDDSEMQLIYKAVENNQISAEYLYPGVSSTIPEIVSYIEDDLIGRMGCTSTSSEFTII